MRRQRRVGAGTIFLVPLRDHGYAAGVVSRSSGHGHAFGYFFGPRIASVEDVVADRLHAGNALLVGKFGDLELVRGNWPTAGAIDPWDSSLWPMQPLARVDEVEGKAWLSKYNENFECIQEEEITVDEAANYPYDRLMGAGSVEIRMTKLLRNAGDPN